MRVKNWHKFQHYKTGKNAAKRPEWIKLYTRLLDDIEFDELDGLDAKALIKIWALASEMEGELPPIKVIAFRLRLSENKTISVLGRLAHWIDGVSYDIPRIEIPRTEEELEEEEERDCDSKKSHLSSGDDVTDAKKANGHDKSDEQKAVGNWNKLASECGLATVRTLTPERTRKLKCRLHEHGLKGWNQALHNLTLLPFCLGQNKSGWKASFDFLLQPTSLNKVLEMAYEQAETAENG